MSKMNACDFSWTQLTVAIKDGRRYLMLRDLILQLRRLSADRFRVDEVFLCGSEPLAQRLQSFMELLSYH